MRRVLMSEASACQRSVAAVEGEAVGSRCRAPFGLGVGSQPPCFGSAQGRAGKQGEDSSGKYRVCVHMCARVTRTRTSQALGVLQKRAGVLGALSLNSRVRLQNEAMYTLKLAAQGPVDVRAPAVRIKKKGWQS